MLAGGDGDVEMAAATAAELLTASQRLAEVERQLDHWNTAEHDIARILLALGFRRPATAATGSRQSEEKEPSLATCMRHLSGGWRMKVQLAKALWLNPRLLLLVEPTNHLDFEALRWLEEQIDGYPHTMVVVSHDVSFLHAVCREILWIKDRKIEPIACDALSPEDLARMQRTKPLHFRFAVADDGPPQNHGVSVHNVEFSYPSESGGSQPSSQALRVKGHIRFSGQSRAVMLGRNGSGKSTFLALCAGRLHPSTGSVDRTQGCKIGHYDQQMHEIDRCSELTAVEYLIQQCREPLEARMNVKAQAAERSAGLA
jgi:ATPase subunit of ABC transporter with duplicated ATPase domains